MNGASVPLRVWSKSEKCLVANLVALTIAKIPALIGMVLTPTRPRGSTYAPFTKRSPLVTAVTSPAQRQVILYVCCMGMMNLSFATVAPATNLTAIAGEFGMNHAEKGLLLSSAFWGVTASLLVAGPLADRCGFRMLLFASALLEATGLAILAWAPQQSVAMIGGAVLGVGTGFGDALFTPLVCALFPDRRTRYANLLHAFYPIGLVISVTVVLLLQYLGWNWRHIVMVLAVLALPCGLAILTLRLPHKSHEGTTRLRGRELLKYGSFAVLLSAIFLAGATELGPYTWLPNFVQEATDGSETQGSLGLILLAATMGVGRLSCSGLIQRFGARKLFVVGGVAATFSLLLAALPIGMLPTILALSVLGFAISGFWPTILARAGDRFPNAGASMYAMLTAAGCFGGVVSPSFMGVVADTFNLRVAFALLAVARRSWKSSCPTFEI